MSYAHEQPEWSGKKADEITAWVPTFTEIVVTLLRSLEVLTAMALKVVSPVMVTPSLVALALLVVGSDPSVV